MRLWTLHPQYLDQKGLLALWREALLAQAVLRGETRGYQNHPQLIRFRSQPQSAAAVAAYLQEILCEAQRRGYGFDPDRIGCFDPDRYIPVIPATRNQLLYEREHLLGKLAARDVTAFRRLLETTEPDPHPLFTVREGGIEAWERVRGSARRSTVSP